MLGVISLFSIIVVGAIYFLFGGPIPQSITWEGNIGTPFQGQYRIGESSSNNFRSGGDPRSNYGTTFTAEYPHTVRFWASRSADVRASSRLWEEQNVQNSIQIRRVGVTCVESYRWGTDISAECAD